jgi:MinD superfamily P-loop ATPase
MVNVDNSNIHYGPTNFGFNIVSGSLDVGQSGSGKIVTEVKMKAEAKASEEKSELIVVDAAAGIGCPVVASVTGADYVIGIAEPTPSGFSDLKRALEMVDQFGINFGIIINKSDLNPEQTQAIEEFASEFGIPIFGKIAYDKRFVDALVNMKPIYNIEEYRKLFDDIANRVIEIMNI